jgi:hypothetical protein
MARENDRGGRPSSITGHQPPEALDQEMGTRDKGMTSADMRKAAGDRKRNAEWPEVHDAFDTRTEEVDRRATGDPLGTPPDPRQTGPAGLPRES